MPTRARVTALPYAAVALTDEIRERCAWVAGRSRHVRIVEDAIAPYAATLPSQSPPPPDLEGAADEARAAFLLTLNAVNFGSGWFPTLRKPPGMSGFRTVEAGLRAHGPWSADALAAMTAAEIAAAVGQDPEHELMALFAAHLRELGGRVSDEEGGSFLALARSGDGSAQRLAQRLGSWPGWRDVSPYDGEPVPFFKRAQIAAADLALAGLAPADDLGALTLFADNLVPHVLRLDGVLAADDALVARIDGAELLEHDSPEEVELRACAVHAVELLVAAHGATTATAVDNALWHRGGSARYKARPRHRARTTDY
jgi:Potential Queuosine, Q, salvage protein family